MRGEGGAREEEGEDHDNVYNNAQRCGERKGEEREGERERERERKRSKLRKKHRGHLVPAHCLLTLKRSFWSLSFFLLRLITTLPGKLINKFRFPGD